MLPYRATKKTATGVFFPLTAAKQIVKYNHMNANLSTPAPHAAPPEQPLRAHVAAFAPRFTRAIAVLLETICRALGNNPRAIIHEAVICQYIQRTRTRFLALLARIAAGIAPRKTYPRKPRPTSENLESERKNPRLRLPSRKAWLAGNIEYYGRIAAGGIATLLNEPATARIIAEHPQSQRLLRPLCHMLGLAIPAVPRLPRKPPKPKPKPKPKQRRLTRRAREAILWYPNSERKPMKLLPKKPPRD